MLKRKCLDGRTLLVSIVASLMICGCLAQEPKPTNQAQPPSATLLAAAKEGDLTKVQDLLDHGADPNAADENGATALMWSAYGGHLDIMKALVARGADPKKKGVIWMDEKREGWYGNLMGIAANREDLPMLAYLLDDLHLPVDDVEIDKEGKETRMTALMFAAGIGNLEEIQFLLERGANVNFKTVEIGLTPLMAAIVLCEPEATLTLLDAGAKVEEKDDRGLTALHYAVLKCVNAIPILLKAGADPTAASSETNERLTPLMLAGRDGNAKAAALLASALVGLNCSAPSDSEKEEKQFEPTVAILEKAQDLLTIQERTHQVRLALAEAHFAWAKALEKQYSHDLAIRHYEAAYEIDKDFRPIHAATDLNEIGRIHDALGGKYKALECYNQAFSIERDVGDRSGEATTLHNIGLVYADLGEKQKALEYYNQALPIRRAVGQRSGEAVTLNNIGLVYSDLGEMQKALEYFNLALPIERAVGDRLLEATTLNNIGGVFSVLGQKQKALEYYTLVLPIRRTVGDRVGEANTLSNIGAVYYALGENQKALEYYNQALSISRAVGDRSGEATTLHNIGSVYSAVGEKQKALEYYNQALPIRKAVGDRSGEAATLNNIGLIYDDLGKKKKAIEFYNQALSIHHAVGDRSGEATTLNNIGSVYDAIGEKKKALEFYNQALPIHRAVGDCSGEAITLNNFMCAWEDLGKPSLAILYGKQSVNIYQQLRSNIRGMEKEIQQTYLKTVEDTYRHLADLLISQGRLSEAQQVLDLLKDEEYFEFVRRDASAAPEQAQLALSPEEAKWEDRYEEIAGRVGALGAERESLLAKKARTEDEERRLDAVESDLSVAQKAFDKFLQEIQTAFTQPEKEGDRVNPAQLKDLRSLQSALRELGPGTVLLTTVVGEKRAWVLLTTPDAQKAGESAITSAALAKKVFLFRQALRDPKADPRPLGKELYDIVVGPVAKDLDQVGAKSILWMLDGVLRYIPMAALYDGKGYLAERYPSIVITQTTTTYLTQEPKKDWTAVAFGVSKPQGDFAALPAVPDELHGIVRDQSNPGGVVPGTVFLNEAFTEAAWKRGLRQGNPVVHVSSHFRFEPGDETKSALLLGDGSTLSLEQIRHAGNLFDGVDLLALSACETAVGGTGGSGSEVDGLGRTAQLGGAKAVLATLWPVADESTALFMVEFYKRRQEHPDLGKAEALREAQLALLRGEAKPPGTSASRTEEKGSENQQGEKAQGETSPLPKLPRFYTTADKPYAHPYFWAPFILIGNGR